jgi:two-component system chemotaxis response regulator CheB
LKILVVDDSTVFRNAITEVLQTVPELNVFKSVVNGKLALDILRLHPDVDLITLDMEMPVMDGLTTIKEIRKVNLDVTIILFSSKTVKGTELIIEALNAGADDFVTKPEGMDGIKEELLPKVLAFRTHKNKRSKIVENKATAKTEIALIKSIIPIKPKLIVIGSSTGGPEALTAVFKSITEKVSIPILLVQHMPAMFTEKLALVLTKYSPVVVREAKNGDSLEAGVCLVAPGDFHMTLNKDGKIHLDQNEKNCFVRPSVNVLLESVANNFDHQVLNIIMTGMGEDGAVGSKKLSDKGAYTYII